MLRINCLLSLLLAVVFLLSPSAILANYCACCAERGEYSIKTRKLEKFETDELKRLEIADTTLFTDGGFPENIKGISPLTEIFSSSLLMQNTLWKFTFKNDKNNSGVLNLSKAPTIVDFRTDTYNEGEPILYKELRFKYRLSGATGIFQKGFAPATEYFLVLQGKGNHCLAAEQFTHWRLEITGKKADYAFFGKLKTKN